MSLAALAVAALLGETPASDTRIGDPRSIELLRQDCRSSIGRREVTLFANGTIRLREGSRGEESLRLAELGRDEVEEIERQLGELDFSETDRGEGSVEGDWVESCSLWIARGAAGAERFSYGRYGSHSLALARAIGVATDLAERAATRSDRPREIPSSYEPRPGDRLERADGELFEIVGRTADGSGVELVGVRLPLTLYLRIEDLPVEFVRLAPARRDR